MSFFKKCHTVYMYMSQRSSYDITTRSMEGRTQHQGPFAQ